MVGGYRGSFASRFTQSTNLGNGVNRQVQLWTYLIFQDSGIVILGNANAVLWFDLASGGGLARIAHRVVDWRASRTISEGSTMRPGGYYP